MNKIVAVVKEIVDDVAHLQPSAVLGVALPIVALVVKVLPSVSIPSTLLVAVVTGAISVAAFLQKLGL